ncbi:TRAP transporter large permease subunit [Pelagibacterium sp.]|uniref:TRAP transporter large permease n=1 Tax=Pelagibacterium sp. TaxID=1967288 RepID=UPI003A9591CA
MEASQHDQMRDHPISRITQFGRSLAQKVAFAGVLGMLGISILTTVDVVVLRSIFNAPIPGSNEFLSTIFAVAIAAVLPSGLAERGMLEVDLLVGKLGDRRADWFRLIGSVAMLLLIILIAWQVTAYAASAYDSGRQTTILQWKTWPFLSAIAIVFIICVPIQLAIALERLLEMISTSSTYQSQGTDDWNRSLLRFILTGVAVVAVVVGSVYFGVQALQGTFVGHGALLAGAAFFVLWVFILLVQPVASAIFFVSFIGIALLMGFPIALSIVGSETAALITSVDLAVIPLFLIMGGLATAGGMAGDIYRLASAIFGFQRGGLALATIGGSAGFGALTGTSLATVATIGKAAYPEMQARGYSKSFSTGCIAAGGTLGQIVPPSSAAVLYALLVDESIGALYIAMLIPAMLSMFLYFVAASTIVAMDPSAAPDRGRFDIKELLSALKGSLSSFVLFGTVIGGIFLGVFTATEAAAVGVLIAFVVALLRGRLQKEAIGRLVVETTQATAMLYFILIAAQSFSFFMGAAGLPELLTSMFIGTGLSPIFVIVLLLAAYIVLGSVMDAFTILIVTAPIVAGIITSLGFDLVWWGVVMVMVIEIGVISPPFGMNLFVMRSVAPDVPLSTIYKGILPFVLVDIVKVALVVALPAIALWLPSLSSAG